MGSALTPPKHSRLPFDTSRAGATAPAFITPTQGGPAPHHAREGECERSGVSLRGHHFRTVQKVSEVLGIPDIMGLCRALPVITTSCKSAASRSP